MAKAQSAAPVAPIAADHAVRSRLLTSLVRFLLTVSLFLIFVGLIEPSLMIHDMGVFERKYSIVSGIRSFFDQGQTALGYLVLVVTVLIPVGKILICFMLLSMAASGPRVTSLLRYLGIASPWSLTEVFILAIVILVLNGQLITSADLLPGAWFFAGGVGVSLVAILIMQFAGPNRSH